MGNKHSQSLMSAGSGETNGNGENPSSIKLEAMSIAARVRRGRGDEIRDARTQAQTEFFWYNEQGDSYKGVTSAGGRGYAPALDPFGEKQMKTIES